MNSKIYSGYFKSPIGFIKVATSSKELIYLEFAKDEEVELIQETEYKPEIFIDTIKQLEMYFKGTLKSFDLKVRFDGTNFQQKAWDALIQIPYGKTISYKEQAIKVGDEKACRAIGGANNKNKIAIVIPCHRVIGSNSNLVGYASGIDKKRWLIEHERKNVYNFNASLK